MPRGPPPDQAQVTFEVKQGSSSTFVMTPGTRAAEFPQAPLHRCHRFLDLDQLECPSLPVCSRNDLDIQTLEAASLGQCSDDLVVEVDFTDEVLVGRITSDDRSKPGIHGSKNPVKFPPASYRLPAARVRPQSFTSAAYTSSPAGVAPMSTSVDFVDGSCQLASLDKRLSHLPLGTGRSFPPISLRS